MKRAWPAALVIAGGVALASCEREMHDMYRQPRFDPDESSSLFPDGRATRPPPPGSVAVAAKVAASTAAPPALARLERGRERFEIACAPCHGVVGDGDGTVVRRGFPRPPSYHEDRLRGAPDRHFLDVIANGYGVMASYADRVAPEDRGAIVAYIRALQLSQHAELARLPASLRAELGAALPAASAASTPEGR